jgi:hypothetical protein
MSGAFTLALQQFAAKAEANADAAVRNVVLEVGSRIILRATAVTDTGRFRGNWRYSVGQPAVGTVETGGTSESPAPPPEPPVLGPGEGAGRIHYWANNLPYAWPLERGHSKRGQGFVALTVMEFAPIVNDAAAAASAGVER